MYEEGPTIRVLSIALHPFIVGHPFRAKHLERALAHIRKRDAVWLAVGSEILDWYKTATIKDHPRSDCTSPARQSVNRRRPASIRAMAARSSSSPSKPTI